MKSIHKPTFADIMLIVFTASLWASAFSAIKTAVPETGPFWLAASRVTIGFLVLLPVGLYQGLQLPATARQALLVLAVCLFNLVFPFVLIAWGQKAVSSGTSAMIMGASPFWALIISHFFTPDDHINKLKLLAVFLGVGGIALVFSSQIAGDADGNSLLPMLAIGGGGLCYVISGIFTRYVHMRPIQFTTLALGISSLILFAIAFGVDGVPERLPRDKALLSLVWLGVFPTGIAYVLRYYLIQRVGISLFSLGINLTPVLGVMFGALLLGEKVTPQTLLALVLILGGLLIGRLGARQPAGVHRGG